MNSRKKPDDPERKARRMQLLWPILIIVVVTVVRMISGGGHSASTNMDDTLLGLAVDSNPVIFLSFDEIRSVELVDEIGAWELLDGSSDEKYVFGTCKTEHYGEARVCAYLTGSPYIVLTLDREIFIYNLSTAKNTEKDYNKLLEAINM